MLRACFVLTALMLSTSLQAQEIHPFTAHYHLTIDGWPNADMTHQLARDDNGWRTTMHASVKIATGYEYSRFHAGDDNAAMPWSFYSRYRLFGFGDTYRLDEKQLSNLPDRQAALFALSRQAFDAPTCRGHNATPCTFKYIDHKEREHDMAWRRCSGNARSAGALADTPRGSLGRGQTRSTHALLFHVTLSGPSRADGLFPRWHTECTASADRAGGAIGDADGHPLPIASHHPTLIPRREHAGTTSATDRWVTHWDGHQQRLHWVDILGGELHQLDPDSNQHQVWRFDEPLAYAVPNDQGGYLAAFRSGLWQLDDQGQKQHQRVAGPQDPETSWCNDGHCDAHGRLWIGTKNAEEQHPTAALFSHDGQTRQHVDGVTISNGLAISPDNRWLYFSDTPTHHIYRYPLDIEQGTLGTPELFADTRALALPGSPDGAAIDEAGHYWVAMYGGGGAF